MITIRTLDQLPGIDELRKLSQSIAMLDAILMPEWAYRFYSFNSKWAAGENMASMRNGSGDSYFILFSKAGAILKGFAHESAMGAYMSENGKPWPGVLDTVPGEFENRFLKQPAFVIDETTFCAWCRYSGHSWQIGKIDFPDGESPDGSGELLYILDGNPRTYHSWAEDYYEREIPLHRVEQVYGHQPLSDGLIKDLNMEIGISDLREDITEIGYPMP